MRDIEGDLTERAGSQPSDPKLGGLGVDDLRHRREYPIDLATDDLVDQAVFIQLLGLEGGDPPPIAKYGDAIGNGKDLVEAVTDVEDRLTACCVATQHA